MTDSPVGLAAYVLQIFSMATMPNFSGRSLDDGGLTQVFQLDDLLNNIMIYWVNGNMVSAMRYYKESALLLIDDLNG